MFNFNNKDNTIKEKSCGAVVYKKENDDILFMILKHHKGHFGFPKGHIETGESEIETAIREVKEESNIDVLIDQGFKEISTYSPQEGIIKDVILFLGKAVTFNAVAQTSEIESVVWCTFDEAENIITYEKDKIILERAYKYIMDSNFN